MEQKVKDALEIVFNLYKDDRIIKEELFNLLECIMDKEEKTTYYPYYPYYPYDYPDKIWFDTNTVTSTYFENNDKNLKKDE